MAEGREETTNEITMPEERYAHEIFAPIRKRIEAKLALIEKDAERLRNECKAMPDTQDGRVQVQIGQLAQGILDTKSSLWILFDNIGYWILLLIGHIDRRVDNRTTREQVRNELTQMIDGLLQKIESSEKIKSPTLTTKYIS